MAVIDILKNNFTAGELSPLSIARSDITRYANGAQLLDNWQVLIQGGITWRKGTRFVALAKHADKLCILKPFEPSVEDAYILEIGEEYLRFYKNGARIEVASVPVEVVTDYLEAHLRLLRTAQANDVMILVNPFYPPTQLSRISDTVWTFNDIYFDPPALWEPGHNPAVSITPSATTGTITLTASAAAFLLADVNRIITAGSARLLITAYTSTTVVTCLVLSPLPNTSAIASGDWALEGSPVANLRPYGGTTGVAVVEIGPVGSRFRLILESTQDGNAELVTDGDFSSGLTSWTNLSSPLIASGTQVGTGIVLNDATQNFYDSGVQPNHIVLNTTRGVYGIVLQIRSAGELDFVTLPGGGILSDGGDWDLNDDYEVRQTGGADGSSNVKASLTGGQNGLGWIRQAITTVATTVYRLLLSVLDGPISLMISTGTLGQDVYEEQSFPIGNEHEVLFVARGTTTYLHFRNNQNAYGAAKDVSVKKHSIDGWRADDVDKYVTFSGGLAKILSVVDASIVTAELQRVITSDDVAAARAWKLQASAWSSTLGYPSAVAFFEGRLYLAGSARFPQTVWGSAIDDFYNFFPGTNQADAVYFPIVDSAGNITLNQIRWLMPGENLLAGTTHGEYRLAGPTEGAFTAALPPLVRLQSAYGSDAVQPVRVGQSILMAQRKGSKVRQMAFDADASSAFLARDLSALSGHLLGDYRVLEMAYQPEPVSYVWMLRSDGVALCLTYDLLEEVVGWHHHTTDGVIESIATIPHPSSNAYQAWWAVQRTINGATARYIEYMDEQASMTYLDAAGASVGWKGLTLDCAVVYSGAATATITGLAHFNGETVSIVGDGIVFPPQVVSGGQVVLSQAVSSAFVGLPYTSRAELLTPDAAGPRGSIMRRRKRWVELTAYLYQTVGLRLNDEVVWFRDATQRMNQGVPPYTGERGVDGLLGDTDRRPIIVAERTEPLPATILGILGLLDVEGEQ
jgi:hypothetical protein